ncbi:hypothetical protein IKE84_02380 [Candidatus Saccharibacteria bacterium]|nr:hypothetical protein [Candidatus Saccharibacteria bacterium]
MDKNGNISWEAEEYISRDKNIGWYIALIIIGLAATALTVLIKWWTFAALIVVSVIALIVYSVRPPRMLKYSLNSKGLKENKRTYNFEEYKSFGVINDGGHYAIVLTPRKRFSGRVWVYFPEQQGEEIVDAFGAKLPMEEVKLDVIDKIVRLLRI